jgi:hypothetical protein
MYRGRLNTTWLSDNLIEHPLYEEESDLRRESPWRIDRVVPRGITMLYGLPSVGKSFVAMDWAYSVATGVPWLGRYPVKQGSVVYVMPEGAAEPRMRAWKVAHAWKGKVAPVSIFTGELHLINDYDRFVREVRAEDDEPRFFIFDTMARCMAGSEENASKDMSQFVERAANVAAEFGADVVIVHHPGRAGEDERGHTNLRGAIDAAYRLQALDDVREPREQVRLLMKTTKPPRDGMPLPPLSLIRKRVKLYTPQEAASILKKQNAYRSDVGLPLLKEFDPTSCVIEAADQADEEHRPAEHNDDTAKALAALAECGQAGARSGEWKAKSGLRGGTFDRTRSRLLKDGKVSLTEAGLYTVAEPEAA